MKRKGLTLVELLVMVGILMLLLALVLPAIQRVRTLSQKLQGEVKIKNIVGAMQHYASQRLGKLPGTFDATGLKNPTGNGDEPALFAYVFYLHSELNKRSDIIKAGMPPPVIEAYQSPSDNSLYEPSLITLESERKNQFLGGHSSYATNMLVHLGRPRLSTAMPDGLSHTIYVGEHNYLTENGASKISYFTGIRNWSYNPPVPDESAPMRRAATFADVGWGDVVPMTTGSPPVTKPSIPHVTFQHLPAIADADHRLLQSTLPCGLLVGMGDGSVKCLSPRIAVGTYWSLITPNGGELVRLDDE